MKHLNNASSPMRGFRSRLTSSASLALQRWRRHWFLLFITGIGMTAAVILACMLPLLTSVMQNAGLQNALKAAPANSEISLQANSIGLSTNVLNLAGQYVNPPFQGYLAPYLQQKSSRLEIQTPELNIITPILPTLRTPLRLYGNPIEQVASHVQLLQGRLPRTNGPNVEIALTPETARDLHVQVGSTMLVGSGFSLQPLINNRSVTFEPSFCSVVPSVDDSAVTSQDTYCQRIKLVVVGLFEVKANDYFWHGENFQRMHYEFRDFRWHYSALVSNQSLLAAFDRISAHYSANAVYFLAGYYASLTWYYYLNPASISVERLDDLIHQLSAAQESVAQSNGLIFASPQPIVQQLNLQGPALSNLVSPGLFENYRSRLAITRIPVAILTLQIICLLLFFVSIMVELLIDRQASAIAILRSRGASTSQIFGAQFTQGLLLSLLALIIGPPLALAATLFIAHAYLPASAQDILQLLTNTPLGTLLNIKWYALLTVGMILVVLAAAIFRATRQLPGGSRSATSSSGHSPLWHRLNLDLVAALIALVGYAISLYLSNISGVLDTRTQALISAPLALIAPVFLLLGAMLLLLRLSPLLLNMLARLAARGKGAVPTLATTQLSRAPRHSMRMILLLALATAFALFTPVLVASQAQRSADLAAYQVGADFSGSVPSTAPLRTDSQRAQQYRAIPGVQSATAAYIGEESVGQGASLYTVQVQAIDPATYAQTILWPSDNASQPLSSLLAKLVSERAAAIRQGVLPALVDSYTWNMLHLHVGEAFYVHQNGSLTDNVRYIAVAEVQSIPTITPVAVFANLQLGNMLVDYDTFAAIQLHRFAFDTPANYVWLRTSDDPATISRISHTLQSPDLYLEDLQNRRDLLRTMTGDPLYLNLLSTLAAGMLVVLLIALVGGWIASWLSVRLRLSQFIVLRALGASPRQIIGVLFWEQGVLYLVALLIGTAFGVLLAFTVVPALILSTLPGIPGADIVAVYAAQQVIASPIVFPASLGLVFAALLVLCLGATAIVTWIALRPAMSPLLRLENEQPPLPTQREQQTAFRVRPARHISVQTVARHPGRSFLTLAFGQLRRTWFLLLMTGLGLISAIILVCAIPLLSNIMTTAGIQRTLAATSGGSEITLDASTLGASTRVASNIQQQISPLLRSHLGNYLNPSPRLSIEEAGFSSHPQNTPPGSLYPLKFFATPMDQIGSHITLQQGRIPASTSKDIEALLTVTTASRLKVQVGSVISVQLSYALKPNDLSTYDYRTATLKLHVVGLVTIPSVTDYFWHGISFEALPGDPTSSSTVILPTTSFLKALDHLATTVHTDAVFTANAFDFLWDYSLDAPHVSYSQLPDLSQRLNTLRIDIQNKYGNLQNVSQAASSSTFPYFLSASVYNPQPGSLAALDIIQRYLNRADALLLPSGILALLVICLILLFISLMADLIVEHQSAALAILRSRGASSSQILACLITQGLGLGLLALLIGPPLALLVVSTIASHLLGPQEQSSIHLFLANPLQSILSVGWYALATAIVVILALSLLFRRAANMNVLSLRHETARSSHSTFWQHFRLDIVAAIIALTAFGLSLYLTSLGNQLDASTKTLILAPLSITASIFFILALLIVFLRVFPFLLRLSARFVSRRRGAVSMLALAQMARTPRYALRTLLLPAFATAFIIFTLTYNATQLQHTVDVANYVAGADFSGDVPADADRLTAQDEIAIYKDIPGVTSVTIGYTTDGYGAGFYPVIPVQILAADTNTFAQTILWPANNSSLSLDALMARLRSLRRAAEQTNTFPVIIDAVAAQKFHISVGDFFTVVVQRNVMNPLHCQVIAVVQHIPTINNNLNSAASAPAGMLLDYQTFTTLYKSDQALYNPNATPPLPYNHVWLRTSDDAAALQTIRSQLQIRQLHLNNLYDRRALIDELNRDSLQSNILAFLGLGTGTVLLLALFGDLLASWLGVRLRLSQFVVLRALGASARQVAGILTLEQGIIHIVALALGGLLGIILAVTTTPALLITNIPASGPLSNIPNDQFFSLQQVVPSHILIPPSLGIILPGLVLLFILVLGFIMWQAFRPTLGQSVRVNED
ncbi:MAG TPA: FtsX-like permease family protein [Ktedonobacteraceae bacterium]|jgi:ABC-type lipoprotein release transport system permease subunit|nr:FtsX-like permease family protein [Ktedonobacteraceae bacterium]